MKEKTRFKVIKKEFGFVFLKSANENSTLPPLKITRKEFDELYMPYGKNTYVLRDGPAEQVEQLKKDIHNLFSMDMNIKTVPTDVTLEIKRISIKYQISEDDVISLLMVLKRRTMNRMKAEIGKELKQATEKYSKK